MLVLDQVKKGDPKLRWLAALVLVGMGILLTGLWFVQVVWRHQYQDSLEAQSYRNVRLPAVRGKILDRNGKLLAENHPRYNVNLYLEDIREGFKYAYTNTIKPGFTERMGRKPKGPELWELQELARYVVASNIVWHASAAILPQPLILNPKAFSRHYREKLAMPMPIVTDLTPQQIGAFAVKSMDLPGVELEVEPFRYYPHGSLAAHVLGYVQQERKTDEDEEEDYLFRYRLPDYVGRTGIESGFDEELRGKAGGKAILVNNIGYRQSEETWLPPDPGKNVVLTLDLELQKATEKALRGNNPDTRGAAVVLDVHTGDILAMASAPAYDINMFVQSRDYSKEDWDRLNDSKLLPQYNRALQGTYHPGSIFKIIVALAAFEKGIMTPDDTVTHPGYYMVGRRKINDTAPPGTYNFKDAFKHSCNAYFIEYGLQAGMDPIIEMGNRFGLGERTGVVPSKFEYRGYFPEVGERLKKDGSRWMDGDTANLCIGQGEIMVTPLQMALMTAAVANGGKLMSPRLVLQLQDPQNGGTAEAMPPPKIDSDLNIKPRTLQVVREAMLADVEEEGGTGKAAFIPGMGISGKTGTAQVRTRHGMDYVTWFVSFAPFDSPRYAVVVMVESGSSGGGTCAPKAKEIYKALQKMEQGQNTNLIVMQ